MGINSIRLVPSEIHRAGFDSVFLITGKHLQAGIELSLFNEFEVTHFIKSGINAEEKEINTAYDFFMKNKHQAVVAIGGGSVIDIAKAIIYRCIESSLPVPFFVAAPATAGSGSEATHFAVVYNGNKKRSLVHPKLMPEVAVLDAQLSFSLPAYQTAVSGMDVLAQAVESYWNVNATPESKLYAAESIGLWKKYFLQAVNTPGTEAREKMLLSAHLAGKAINITRTTGPHAISYYLTANHNIPHGQAVALFLPVFFLYNKPGDDLYSLLGVSDALDAKEQVQSIMKQAGLSASFAELDLNKENILDELLNEVNEERFANNPVKFNRDKLKQLINQFL